MEGVEDGWLIGMQGLEGIEFAIGKRARHWQNTSEMRQVDDRVCMVLT